MNSKGIIELTTCLALSKYLIIETHITLTIFIWYDQLQHDRIQCNTMARCIFQKWPQQYLLLTFFSRTLPQPHQKTGSMSPVLELRQASVTTSTNTVQWKWHSMWLPKLTHKNAWFLPSFGGTSALVTQLSCYKEAPTDRWRDAHGEKPWFHMHSSSKAPRNSLLTITHLTWKWIIHPRVKPPELVSQNRDKPSSWNTTKVGDSWVK